MSWGGSPELLGPGINQDGAAPRLLSAGGKLEAAPQPRRSERPTRAQAEFSSNQI